MRKARTNHASAALNGEIYAVGGKASPLRPGWLAQAPLQPEPGGLSVLQQPSPTPMPLPGTREPPCWFRAPEALLPILPSGARCLGQTSHTRSPSQMVPPAARVSLGEPQAESRQPAPGGLRCIPGTLRTGQQRGPRGLGLRLPTEVAPPSPSHGLSPSSGGHCGVLHSWVQEPLLNGVALDKHPHLWQPRQPPPAPRCCRHHSGHGGGGELRPLHRHVDARQPSPQVCQQLLGGRLPGQALPGGLQRLQVQRTGPAVLPTRHRCGPGGEGDRGGPQAKGPQGPPVPPNTAWGAVRPRGQRTVGDRCPLQGHSPISVCGGCLPRTGGARWVGTGSRRPCQRMGGRAEGAGTPGAHQSHLPL